MVALSGGHTIGFSHCKEFMPRIYDYNKTFDVDPTMDQHFAQSLRGSCPKKKFDPIVVALNDVTTPFIFDNSYYQNLQKGLGLLATDQMLILDSTTGGYVKKMAENQNGALGLKQERMVILDEIVVPSMTGSCGVEMLGLGRNLTGIESVFSWLIAEARRARASATEFFSLGI
ncbi:peroxidase 65-like [Pistacia vera]|uniref:peroxidase 65-like n=1 Tax=Pistacia vera TaxID=55513 RepID=UPI0012637D6F|nr:peroxidase 65-like [Pistacia vera]